MKVLLKDIYTDTSAALKRFKKLEKDFESLFKFKPANYFSVAGRTELCGNHTDHNGGKVLAASVSLDIAAVAKPIEDNIIQIKSAGFPLDAVDISNTQPHPDENGKSAALIRGMAGVFKRFGYNIGGFTACTTSDIPKGSGLSSSAAFEVLVGNILNSMYNDGKISNEQIAVMSQIVENEYFGKPSGLMDQMACSVGGIIEIDFADSKNPIITKINSDISSGDYTLCIVDTKGSHADLTPDYAAVPAEMKSIAGYFGKNLLRDVEKQQITDNIAVLREKFGDRAVMRSLNFFDENKRVEKASEFLKIGNINGFVDTINQSGNSSFKYLQNVYSPAHPENQEIPLGLLFADGIGGVISRVHGGGFAGTIQAYVPNEKLEEFKNTMENLFGENSCFEISIRKFGGTEIDKGEFE